MSHGLPTVGVSNALGQPPTFRWPDRAHRFALRLAFTLFIISVSLLAAEYLARFMFRHAHSSGRAGDFVATHGGGPAIVANHLGFREREVPAKNPGRYRIAVVGDSFTWGQGIETGERFSNLLENFLGPQYEVLNFGRPGDNLPEHLEVLEQALPVSPDFVLLQLYINDFETPQMERPRPYSLLPGSLDRTFERSSVLYDLMNQRWAGVQPSLGIVDTYERYMARNLEDPAAPNSRAAFGQLNEFIERTRRAGVACGTVLFPAPDAMGPNGSHYPFGYLHDRVRLTCGNQHIQCVDLLPDFSTIHDPRTMWVSPFDAHPNAMANRRAAEQILRQFAPIWRGHNGSAGAAH
jgi:lysophospholipase L1-like esterase